MERNNRRRQNASAAQVVRKSDRRAKGIHFSRGAPVARDGTYKSGHSEDKGKYLKIEWGPNPGLPGDPHRVMVCDMKAVIDKVVDDRFSTSGKASTEDKELFKRLVKEEKDKDRKLDKKQQSNYPYKARAALGLIQLLSSILG